MAPTFLHWSLKHVRVVVPVALLLWPVGIHAAGARLITNGSNVRLRSAPDTSASIVTEMPVGTELSTLDQPTEADVWLRVRTDDGREGWVLGRLTTSIDPAHRDYTIEAVVADQLERHAGMPGTSFAARVQLFDLIERETRRLAERETVARFTLYRLRSMRDVFQGIPFGGGQRDPYQRWVQEHYDEGRFNEPVGRWMVAPEYALKIHEQYRDTKAADEIAWFHAVNGLPGECEGYVSCYVDWTNALDGEYLRLRPGGRHSDDATARIAKFLDALGSSHDKDSLDCPSFRESLQSLASAITASSSVRKPNAVVALKRIAELSALCP